MQKKKLVINSHSLIQKQNMCDLFSISNKIVILTLYVVVNTMLM